MRRRPLGLNSRTESPAAVRCLQGKGEDMGTGNLGIGEVDVDVAGDRFYIIIAGY